MNLSTDVDDTILVKILEHILTNVGDITGNFFGSELGVSCFDFVLFYMDRCVNIFTNDFFTDKNSILVVVTFPGHKADESILTKGDFAVLCSRTISQNIALANSLTTYYNRVLIDTCALVTSEELDNLMVLDFAIVILNTDSSCIRAHYNAVILSKDTNA